MPLLFLLREDQGLENKPSTSFEIKDIERAKRVTVRLNKVGNSLRFVRSRTNS